MKLTIKPYNESIAFICYNIELNLKQRETLGFFEYPYWSNFDCVYLARPISNKLDPSHFQHHDVSLCTNSLSKISPSIKYSND